MRYISLFIVIITAVVFSACKKNQDKVNDSLSGRNVYAIKLLLSDTLGGAHAYAETDSIVKVYLYDTQVNADANLYVYTKSTQGKGVAILDFLKSEIDYKITSSLAIGSVKYKGDTTFKTAAYDDRNYLVNLVKDTIKLSLYADVSNRNALKVLVVDNAAKRPVPNASVCLFASKVLFDTRNCANANYSSVTSATGKCQFDNVAPGNYYVYSKKALDTTATPIVLSGIDSVTINYGEIKPVTINSN